MRINVMETIGAILIWAMFGLFCGAIARLLIPGHQPMGILMTMLLGVIGSFVGGFVAFLLSGGQPLQASGFILSVIGAVVTLGMYVAFARHRQDETYQ